VFAQFRAPDFRLLIFAGSRHAADVNALAAIGNRVHAATDGRVRPLVITSDNIPGPDDVIVLNDPKRSTHVSYGASTPALYLIRPDGYVGFRCPTGDEAELLSYLQRHYGIVTSRQARTPDGCLC
jgi:4,5-epoxidase